MDTACLDVKTASTGLCRSLTKDERHLAMLRPFADNTPHRNRHTVNNRMVPLV